MAIAEHHPEKLHKANRGVLKMSHEQLHDFASSKVEQKKKELAKKMSPETQEKNYKKFKKKYHYE